MQIILPTSRLFFGFVFILAFQLAWRAPLSDSTQPCSLRNEAKRLLACYLANCPITVWVFIIYCWFCLHQ